MQNSKEKNKKKDHIVLGTLLHSVNIYGPIPIMFPAFAERPQHTERGCWNIGLLEVFLPGPYDIFYTLALLKISFAPLILCFTFLHFSSYSLVYYPWPFMKLRPVSQFSQKTFPQLMYDEDPLVSIWFDICWLSRITGGISIQVSPLVLLIQISFPHPSVLQHDMLCLSPHHSH